MFKLNNNLDSFKIMITIEKVGDAIRFTFVGNDHYLNEGTIEVPINSLSLVTDDSGMATFKKSSSNDVFISATYQELGMTKAELEEFYKENMVGKVGSEITPEEVEEMIDEAVSGKLDTSAITTEITSASTDSQVPSAKLMYDVIDEIEDVTATALNSLNERLDDKQDQLIAGSGITISGNVISADGGITSGEVQDMIDESISGKADSSAVTEEISAAVSGKVDTSAITSSVTSASTDSEVPTAKAVHGVATTDEYPIEGVLSAKHFWDDENMGAYTEIGSLNNIKVPNSSLLSNPYISYVFAENEEFMGDTCALVATVTNGSIASVELLNGSSVSSVTATYDNDYMYFTTSASSFSADGLNIVAVMGNDFKPSNVMELRMHITESAVDCGVISVVGNIPSEPTKDSIKRIYDALSSFDDVNPIADTITLDNGNNNAGRDNTLIGYGVLNYNTYNPLTNTITSGNTADVFKYNVIDFKGDNNVLRFNKTIIDKSTFSSTTPQFAISSFTDGDTSSYNYELFQPTTCMIVETNPNASGGGGMGDEINISISGPNNIEGGISFQLRNSTLEVNVTYNNKTVNKVLYSFANGDSLLIDLRDYWDDTYGTHTFTVDNWRGSNMLTKISFYTSVVDRNQLHLEDAVEMLMDKETITLDELDDKLIDYASIESVNIYEYGNPSAVTVSTSSLNGTFYGFSVSGIPSGNTVQWYISDGQVSIPYGIKNGVIDNNNDSTFDHCFNKELTNYENGVVNVFLNTSDVYISRIYMSSQSYQGTVYQSITVTPIKDALSGKVDTSAITSSVTSASTDSEVPTAKAVYDAISAGGGGLDDDFLQATANALYDNAKGLKDTNDNLAANYYTKTQGDARYATNASVASKYYNKEYIDDKLLATAGALNNLNDELETKQDQLIAGSGINISGNVISADGGGGKAIEGGRGITVTTGATADTVSFNLPISASTTNNNLLIGDASNKIYNQDMPYTDNCIVFGRYNYVKSYDSLVGGYQCSNEKGQSQSFGNYTKTKNQYEFGCGKYNNSVSPSTTFGDSGNTLFSVGNGTADNARHNAFEIRQNGDIYCSDGTNDVKLQDTITATAANTSALGGLKLVQLTQAEYDALVTKDSSTLYVITNN